MSDTTMSYILDTMPRWAFVQHPHLRGSWLRVHPCVVLVACPHCKAPVGVPCRGTRGQLVATHHTWRSQAVPADVLEVAGKIPALALAQRKPKDSE